MATKDTICIFKHLIALDNTFSKTWWLTTGQDNIKGTTGVDTVTGSMSFTSGALDSASTLSVGDSISLSTTGTSDVLKITVQGADVNTGGYTTTPTLVGVDQVLVNNAASDKTDAVTIDLSLADSAVKTIGTATSSVAGVATKFANVGQLVAVQEAGYGDLSVSFGSTVVAGTADALNVTFNGTGNGVAAPATFTTSGIETLNLTSSTLANSVKLSDAAATTVNVAGTKAIYVDLNGSNNTSIATVNASTATGDVTLNATGLSTAATITGGAGNDTLYRATVQSSDSLVGGAGTDTLAVDGAWSPATTAKVSGFEKIAATNVATNGAAITVGVGNLTGVTGVATGNQHVLSYDFTGLTPASVGNTYSIAINGTSVTSAAIGTTDATSTALALKNAINGSATLSALVTASNVAGVLTITANDGVSGVNITTAPAEVTTNGAGGTTANGIVAPSLTFTGLAAASTVDVFAGTGDNYAGTVNLGTVTANLKDATGTADAMTVNLDGGAGALNYAATSLVVDAGLESLTLNSGGTIGKTKSNTLSDLTGSSLKTLTVTGDSNLILSTLTNDSKLATINASALTGNLTITTLGAGGSTAGVAITGGSGNDTIKLGGTHTITNVDTIDGGAGTADALTATVSATTATSGVLHVANVETVNLTVSGTSTIDATSITGASLLAIDGTASVSVTNLGAGATVGLGDATGTYSTGTATLALKDATGTADTLNLAVNAAAGATSLIKTAGIETLNVSTNVILAGTEALDLYNTDASKLVVSGSSTNANSRAISLDGNASHLSKYVTSIDAIGILGTGDFTANATNSTGAVTITGGSGNDILTGSSTKNTTFNIGTAFDVHDVVTGNAVTGAANVLNATIDTTATINAGSKITSVQAINYTVGNGVTATYSAADDLAAAAIKTVAVTGGNVNSVFTVTDTTTLAFGGAGFTGFDATGFAGKTDIVIDAAALATGKTLKAGTGTSDWLRVAGANTSYTPAGISGFDNILFDTTANANTLDLSNVTGATNVYAENNGVVSKNLTITNIGSGTTINLGDISTDAGGYSTHAKFGEAAATLKLGLTSVSGTADALTVKLLNQGSAGAIATIQTDGVENLTLNAVNANKDFNLAISDSNTNNVAVTLTGGNATVGNNTVTLATSSIGSNVTSIDASTLTDKLVMSSTARSGTQAITITGGSAADTIVESNVNDSLTGGAGVDTLIVKKAASLGGLAVDLSATTGTEISLFNGSSATHVLGFENIDASGYTGSFGSDITAGTATTAITGTSNGDTITGSTVGGITINGYGGNDTVTLGTHTSADTVYVQTSGVTTISGFVHGTDIIHAGGATTGASAVIVSGVSYTNAVTGNMLQGTAAALNISGSSAGVAGTGGGLTVTSTAVHYAIDTTDGNIYYSDNGTFNSTGSHLTLVGVATTTTTATDFTV